VNVVIANGRKIVPNGVRTLVEEKVGRLLRHCPGLEPESVKRFETLSFHEI
jgi:hypothetical protein